MAQQALLTSLNRGKVYLQEHPEAADEAPGYPRAPNPSPRGVLYRATNGQHRTGYREQRIEYRDERPVSREGRPSYRDETLVSREGKPRYSDQEGIPEHTLDAVDNRTIEQEVRYTYDETLNYKELGHNRTVLEEPAGYTDGTSSKEERPNSRGEGPENRELYQRPGSTELKASVRNQIVEAVASREVNREQGPSSREHRNAKVDQQFVPRPPSRDQTISSREHRPLSRPSSTKQRLDNRERPSTTNQRPSSSSEIKRIDGIDWLADYKRNRITMRTSLPKSYPKMMEFVRAQRAAAHRSAKINNFLWKEFFDCAVLLVSSVV